MKTSNTLSIVYNFLIKTYKLRKINFLFQIWKTIWNLTLKFNNTLIRSKLHGYKAILPIGHWYLLVLQNYPKFNQPLVSLVQFLEKKRKKELTIIDVGSAVGDTVLLIESIKSYNHRYVCIDGDDDYNKIIAFNTEFIRNRIIYINSLVSDEPQNIGKIKKENPTTGYSSNDLSNLGYADSLDNLLKNEIEIDLIKIDIDGYDGKAIAGMEKILAEKAPAIIFEWNVPLFHRTKNSIELPFEILEKYGYMNFFWFDNFGNFLFYQNCFDGSVVSIMAKYSEKMESINGIHFDIVCLKDDLGFIDFIN